MVCKACQIEHVWSRSSNRAVKRQNSLQTAGSLGPISRHRTSSIDGLPGLPPGPLTAEQWQHVPDQGHQTRPSGSGARPPPSGRGGGQHARTGGGSGGAGNSQQGIELGTLPGVQEKPKP